MTYAYARGGLVLRATPAKFSSVNPPAAGSTVVGVVLTGLLSLTACGTPPELAEPTGGPPRPTGTQASPGPSTSAPTATPPAGGIPTNPAPPVPATGAQVATPCAGRPDGRQVIDLLRRGSGLPRGVRVTVTVGPLCADDWQYSVVQIPDREPLQVVSTGRPAALTLVTAGTDVCDARVKVTAPPGIRTLACDGGPLLPPPA
jgi:hypothetical protein